MSFKIADGFTHYASGNPLKRWTASPTIDASNPIRAGVKAGYRGAGLYAPLGDLQTATVGLALRTTVSVGAIIFCYDSIYGHVQCQLVIEPDGSLTFRRGLSTVLAQSSAGIFPLDDTWHVLECSVMCDSTNGIFRVRLDGTEVPGMFQGGMNTRESASGLLYGLVLSIKPSTDLWVSDEFEFLATPAIIDTLLPAADGAETQWTPTGGGSNHVNVDDPGNIDRDAGYNYSNVTGTTDTFILSALPSRPGYAVCCVALSICARNEATGGARLAPVIRIAGHDYVGAPTALPSADYETFQFLYATSPATGLPWTDSELAGAQFGYRVYD